VYEDANIADISQVKYEIYETFDENLSIHKFTTVGPLTSCETVEPTVTPDGKSEVANYSGPNCEFNSGEL
jgi:hypothetical protein